MDFFGTFGLFGIIFPVFFVTIFCLVVGTFIFAIVRGIKQYSKNEASPVLSVDAKVVSKRTNLSTHHDFDDHRDHRTSSYYATFEVDSGDRIELNMVGSEYGKLVEGDIGKLTFQGTRYLGFERKRNQLN